LTAFNAAKLTKFLTSLPVNPLD